MYIINGSVIYLFTKQLYIKWIFNLVEVRNIYCIWQQQQQMIIIINNIIAAFAALDVFFFSICCLLKFHFAKSNLIYEMRKANYQFRIRICVNKVLGIWELVL